MNARHNGDGLWLWCPGCDDTHRVVVSGPGAWTWNGSTEVPTVHPSIKVTSVQWDKESVFHRPQYAVPAGRKTVCHSFLENGRWRFLADSTHALAGQIVPMVPLPEGLFG